MLSPAPGQASYQAQDDWAELRVHGAGRGAPDVLVVESHIAHPCEHFPAG